MSSSSWQENEPMSDINVTPFVDVLLVLLIIFMVTAPIINHVVQVELPKDSYSQDRQKPMQESVRVVIDRKGVLYWGDVEIGVIAEEKWEKKFKDRLQQELAQSQNSLESVDLEADERVRYGELVPVIARLKEAGVSMNLVIRPKAKR
ncbi:MAG: biopolymer transporter ExbD [Deltaproteobacteria bacterium]|jgi:biopolymer transport protein ExbD|nr:biopolymer transporter ExbD [Deltaproteobacteria bacterium]MDP7464386.1 biopolymer transporter ExbD [SAR324 cluster bacterium]